MLKKLSNISNYLDKYSIYRKNQKYVFIHWEIDMETAMSFITNLDQFSHISFEKCSHFSNFVLSVLIKIDFSKFND